MINEMSQIKATANAHMRRDIDAGGKWACECEACHGIRSLMGMEKMLDARPLVREIQQIKGQLHGLPDGPEIRSLQEKYFKLHDQLADVMAK
jgi:hypothetical protein